MTIEQLEEWFRSAPIPQMPVYLDAATKVNDFTYFVTSHFEGLKAAKNEYTRNPLMIRLLKMKKIIEDGQDGINNRETEV